MGNAKTRKLIMIWGSLVCLAILLVGCNDNTVVPTPLPTIQPTIAATTAPITAISPTKDATPTSNADTTESTNISATTVATPGPTRTVSNVSAAPAVAAIAALPAIKNAKIVTIDQSAIDNLVKQLGVPGAATQLFVSTSPATTFSTDTNAALISAGWRFNMTGATKPQTQASGEILGTYVQTGQPDLLFQIKTLPTDQSKLNQISLPGLSAADIQKVSTQLKGQKALMIIIIAPNIAK